VEENEKEGSSKKEKNNRMGMIKNWNGGFGFG
jgi:hypothetical protein